MSEVPPKNRPIYLQAPVTPRSGILLAAHYGFGFGLRNIEQFAETIPENATVLDVGAGHSSLGFDATQKRPDISWTNFDYSYSEEAAQEASQISEAVQFKQGDALRLTDYYEPESVDRVFSYWLLPHLALESPVDAVQTAFQMYAVTKMGGQLAIGPTFGTRIFSRPFLKKTRVWTKTPELSPSAFAYEAVEATTLRGLVRTIQFTHNLSNKPVRQQQDLMEHIREKEAEKAASDERGLYVSIAKALGSLLVADADTIKTVGETAASLADYYGQMAYFRTMLALEEQASK